MSNYTNCWLTLNRSCNMRCEWCYASGTNYDNKMDFDFDKSQDLIKLLISLRVKRITLIGGEPTCYCKLFEIIELLHNNGFYTVLVTNGYYLYDIEFVKKLKKAGLNAVGLSLKGYNKTNYSEITKVDGYSYAMKAISNLNNMNFNFSVSYVLTYDNISSYLEGIEEAFKHGCQFLSLSFCYDFSKLEYKKNDYNLNRDIFLVIDKFIESYDKLCNITKDRFKLSQSFPLCAWPIEFIKKLEAKKQISGVCQLLSGKGLLFDTDLNLIPCNAMYQIKLGKAFRDFKNQEDLNSYLNQKEINETLIKLKSIPSLKCNECTLLSKCGGGCVSNWFNFDMNEFEKAKEDFYARK